jgi:fucose permease
MIVKLSYKGGGVAGIALIVSGCIVFKEINEAPSQNKYNTTKRRK